jgi:putative pyruvate formate lyase activating enzyme
MCSIDRTEGAKGFCGLSDDITMHCALAHFGEEPPVSGTNGAGTIFLSSCNLRCLYCQNYQISHMAEGFRLDSQEFSRVMLSLQDNHCHNVELVSPTPQIPMLMEALLFARRDGLEIPAVYNCGGYENPEVIKMLEGLVDIYLPDFKYAAETEAFYLSGVRDYPQYALESIREMVSQVGDTLETEGDIARRGIIIRHLVLPGFIQNSIEVLKLIKKTLSTSVPLSIMSQYTPIHPMKDHPLLGRRVTREEYESVINDALDMGFETVFTQDVDDRAFSPDFEQDSPFTWS